MLQNIKESHHNNKHFQTQSILGIVFASLTIILNVFILKAYNKNDKFEKDFRDLQIKHSENFIKIWVKDTIKSHVEMINDSSLTLAENMVKQRGKEPSSESEQNNNHIHNDLESGFPLEFVQTEPKLELEKKSNLYEPRSLQRQQSCISPAYYIKPKGLEEEQDQEYNSSLILMMTNIKQ